MAARVEISTTEILNALALAAPGRGPKEARHVLEIAAATGINEKRVRSALRVVAAEGRLVRHRVTRERLDGSTFVCTAFTILPAKKR